MKTLNNPRKALLSTLGFAVYFSGILTASGATLDISQKPLILSETVAPNLVFTLDDSGSMRWAFGPDDIGREASALNIRNARRAKSSTANPMYYNPSVTYRLPVKLNDDGTTPATGYTTSFTNAYQNGFDTSHGTVNLSTSYKVSWNYSPDSAQNYTYSNSTTYAAPTGKIYNLAQNPEPDYRLNTVQTLSLSNGNTSAPITVNNVTFTVKRINNSNCTATTTTVPLVGSLSCSRSGSNYTITSDLRTTATPAYYYIYDKTLLPNCTTTDDNCYTLKIVSSSSGQVRTDAPEDGADERQNFAIWYSFYRTRALATLSAANIAFNELAPSVRLTWQSLGGCTTLNSASCSNNYLRTFGTRHKGNFFNWLSNVNFNQGTPLRAALDRAGKFLQTDAAWAANPNPVTSNGGLGTTVTSPVHACRPSYHVMMTDGMWNGADGSPTGTLKADHNTFTLPDSKSYTNSLKPFGDGTTNTLADLAMHYWATDLRPSLANELKPYTRAPNSDPTKQYWDPKNDPATWQHMINFTMGLALTNSLTTPGIEWAGDTFSGTGYNNLVSGAATWPAAEVSSSNNVYDLWHAAINSRGEFFSVESPDDMVKAFKDILNRIAERTTTAARPAVSASFVSDSTDNSIQSNVYATQFSSEDWSGELTKTLIDDSGVPKQLWSAKTANQNLAASSRTVMIKDTSNSTTQLQSFTWDNLDAIQQALLSINPDSLNGSADSRGASRVAYIRGDRSQEGAESTKFRTRGTIIGDIINSSPVVVGTPLYLSYLADRIENPADNNPNYQSYTAFRQSNSKSVRKEMIYVGGNDGMLHGFNAATGVEEFAFIPSEVIKNLYRITGQNYTGGEHRFYVDGSPVVRDVYFGDGVDEGWRTILIGTLRAGGKALFALDITDPTSIKLLWEFDSSNDSDLGYTFVQPEITRLHTGQWAVLMGNGYNSTDDRAALLIIDIKTGELLKKLVVPEIVESDVTLSNGLSSVRGADNNGDGLVDYAYAGDLQGNLWRFDLVKTGADEDIAGDPFSRNSVTTSLSDFKIAYGDKPLFTAMDSNSPAKRQAITVQPSLVRHPGGQGYLVLIGTGKYFETSDANVDTSRAMTMYGIWDRKTRRQTTTSSTARATDRSKLQVQQFTSQQDQVEIGDEEQSAIHDIRQLSANNVEWYEADATDQTDSSVKHWGWQLDLAVGSALAGEMVINNMSAMGGTLFFTSLTPNQDPCEAGADTWLYGVNSYTGGRTSYNVFDLNNDGIVNSKDQVPAGSVVTGRRFPALGGFTLAPNNKAYGSDPSKPALIGDDPNTKGRQSWHIVPEEFQ